MPAFASAVHLGADCIELDVRASLDTQATVLHDETLERIWGIKQSVASLTYERIFEMTKASDLYVPRLEEVLDAFEVPVMIDFVDDAAVKPIIRALVEQRAAQRCIISSGNVLALMSIRRELKNVSIAMTWSDIIPPSDSLLQELDVQYFNPNYRMYQDEFIEQMVLQKSRPGLGKSTQTGLDGQCVPSNDETPHGNMSQDLLQDDALQELLQQRMKHPEWYAQYDRCGSHMVQRMHDAGRKVSAWTVDDPTMMRKMMDLGVDLITTNDTKTLLEVRNGQLIP